MGMDVTSKNGNYFRSNVWYWRPLVELMFQADADLYNKVGEGWHYNDGNGLDNAEDCKAMADALSTKRMNKVFDILKESSDNLADNEKCKHTNLSGSYPYDREHLDEWIDYLRKSDGFAIW